MGLLPESVFYKVDVTFEGEERLKLIVGGCKKDEPPLTTEEALMLLNEQAEANNVTGVKKIHSIQKVGILEAMVIQIGNKLGV